MTDTNWNIHNDRLSVTVGINTRIGILRRQGLIPTLIRLGKEHSRLFWLERGVPYIPKGPTLLISRDVFWDENNRRWCYSKRMIPMKFNDPSIYGIAVEGVPQNPKKNTC